MPYITQEDYTAMMAPFAIVVTAYAGTGNQRTFNAIYDNWHQLFGDDLQLSGADPVLFCRESDVTGIVQTDPITINNIVYKVRDVQPDGPGTVKLELKK
jgi:hypothetical protein